jgi:hypothetical protein
MKGKGFLEAVLYVLGAYREKGWEGVERDGTRGVKTRKGALPFGKAPLFGVALSCVCPLGVV